MEKDKERACYECCYKSNEVVVVFGEVRYYCSKLRWTISDPEQGCEQFKVIEEEE
jgi:hypothetical protein